MMPPSGVDWSEFRQVETAECGLMCLAAAIANFGGAVSAAEMRRNFRGSVRGSSLSGLQEIAKSAGLQADGVDCEIEDLSKLPVPAVLHWRHSHFVLLIRATRYSVDVFDPALGMRRLSAQEAGKCFDGKALVLKKGAGLVSTRPGAGASLAKLSGVTEGMAHTIALLLCLSMVVQLAVMLLPLMSQLAINRGAMQGDADAIYVIAACMALVYVSSFLAEVWRGYVNQRLATHVTLWTSRKMFRHLLSLPLAWIERRGAADLATRFESVEPLRLALSSGLATLVVDGFLSIFLAAIMLFISPLMGGLLVASVILGVASKFCFSLRIAQLSADATSFRIQEQAKRWETVRGLQAVKLAAAEGSREADWAARLRAQLWSSERAQRAVSLQSATHNFIGGMGSLIILLAGVLLVVRGSLSIGALFAFTIYRRSLSDKLGAVADQISNLWTLKHHLRRVTELFEADPEPRWLDVRTDAEVLPRGLIQISSLAFRHSSQDKPVFHNVSLEARPGELIVIQGPSGAGKSTLLKLIAGLYVPSAGTILLDGAPTTSFAPGHLRSVMAAVSQEDEVLGGTIFENVAYFDESAELELCFAALEAAELAEDVKRMPMGVHTAVGEGGRNLSAGQRQRLLLARAFYKRPRLFLLDESTSNLDPEAEGRILQRLRQSPATKVVISHDMRVAAFADRVFLLSGGGMLLASRRIEEVQA